MKTKDLFSWEALCTGIPSISANVHPKTLWESRTAIPEHPRI